VQFNKALAFRLHSWDIAASTMILIEAGGFIIDPTGMDNDQF
jgi:fructose-1,6-bisphosphatase/inositol monophosphatase family enzyme